MLNPRHILITGASGGIGAALAEIYAAPGVRLSLHGRDESRLARVAEAAACKGAEVSTHSGDVTDQAGMAAWIADCARMAPLDVLIANAGISAGTGAGHETAEQSKAIFAVNLHGVINTVQPAIPIMTAQGRGQIALMSSLASFRGFAGAPSYCASKAAVRIYGEALRGELAVFGVAVNVVCPGFIRTPMTDCNPFPMPFIMSAERAARIIKRGLARDRARIAFPSAAYWLVRLAALLPQDLVNRRMAGVPGKSPKS
ncbi:MAG TPA: SDR family NAD(P)-dependent oxidoreductase [Alphaproteobacteria bacterium]|nr:SDR family NAD(P)-dependent oxidoreductase [Alphaproteobacteria bacterium]